MPELPDVQAFQNYANRTALHQRIDDVTVMDDRILQDVSEQALKRRLKGAELDGTRRHGKFLFLDVSSNGWLVMHFGMTGELAYFKSAYSDEEETPRHTRLLLSFANGYRLAYRCQRMLGLISCTDDVDEFVQAHELGPDALDSEFDADDFLERIEGRSGTIKSTLMNQAIVAGVGNEYADEILFQLGVHPATSMDTLDEKKRRGLFAVMRRVLETAARHEGDTSEFPKGYLLKHRDDDAVCPKCGEQLQTTDVAGRTSCFCPRCQKKDG